MWSLAAAEHSTQSSAVATATYEPLVLEVMSDELGTSFMEMLSRMGKLAGAGRRVDTFIEFFASDSEARAIPARYFDGWARNVPVHLEEVEQPFGSDAPSPTAPGALEQITAPVLILQGTDSVPHGFGSDGAEHVVEHLRAPSVRSIPAAGHFAPIVDPSTVAGELADFFAAASISA